MAFTTWADYLATLKNLLNEATAKGFLTLNQFGAIGPDGVPATYRNLDELRKYINWVESKVVAENAPTDGRGRKLFMVNVQ